MASSSNESGVRQVYVCRFPTGDSKTQITFDAAPSDDPAWVESKDELIFGRSFDDGRTEEKHLFFAKYSNEGETFLTEPAIGWKGITNFRGYDIHPDGDRILIQFSVENKSESKVDHLFLIDHFGRYLHEQLTPLLNLKIEYRGVSTADSTGWLKSEKVSLPPEIGWIEFEKLALAPSN